MIRAVKTAYGPPARSVLIDVVAECKRDDPLAPVAVVVPTNYVGLFARRALGGFPPGIANVTMVTPVGLAQRIGGAALARAGRRPASLAVRAAALGTALQEAPGCFGPVAAHPSTERALLAGFAELDGLAPQARDRLAGGSSQAADVLRLHTRTRELINAGGWFDQADLCEASLGEMRRNGKRIASELGGVVTYLIDTLTDPVSALLIALGRELRVTIVAPFTEQAGLDRPMRQLLDRLGAADERSVPYAVASSTSTVVSAADPDDEGRAAVQRVVSAIAGGTPPGRIALFYPVAQPYSLLIRDQLHAAGIPSSGPASGPLAQTMAGRVALGVLGLERVDLRVDAVAALLATAPLLARDGSSVIVPSVIVPAAAWESIARRAGVLSGPEQWASRLGYFASKKREEARRLGAVEDTRWQAERAEHDAQSAESLGAWVAWLVGALRLGHTLHTWADLAAWMQWLLKELLGDGDSVGHRHWPLHEQAALSQIDAALGRIAEVDSVSQLPTFEAFLRLFTRELDQAGPDDSVPLGTGVLVGPISLAAGAELDLVVLVGLVEGFLPGPVSPDALLGDADRTRVGGLLSLRKDRVDTQHRQLLAAVAAAPTVVVSYPRGDPRRGREWQPSRWVPEISAADATFEVRPSFAAGVALDPVPVDGADADLQRLYRSSLAGAELYDHPVLVRRRGLSAGLQAIRGRRSSDFTRWDGNLAGLRLPPPGRATPVAPTRLEAYARCPHAYFLEHILGVVAPVVIEEFERISPLEAGNLLHAALEAFLRPVLGNPPGPQQPWSALDRERLATIGGLLCDDVEAGGRAGRALLWRVDRSALLADLDKFLEVDEMHRRSSLVTPWKVEHRFDAVEVELEDQRTILVRGSIDRVDRGANHVVVVDYKSGRGKDYVGIEKGDPVRGGSALQLPLYALVARQLAAERTSEGVPDPERIRVDIGYWLLSRTGGNRLVTYPLDDTRLARCREAVGVIVDGIEAGLFPARPPDRDPFTGYVPCRFCNPDGLGTSQARRRWERKRENFALAAYKRLVEDPWPPA